VGQPMWTEYACNMTVCDRLRSVLHVINNTNDLPGDLIKLHAMKAARHQPSFQGSPAIHPYPTSFPFYHWCIAPHHQFIPSPHRHSNSSAWRSSLHIGASTLINISAASHVILRRDMPCQTELQACPPNFNHPTRERILS
jgi:hypothetical protein